MKESPRDQNQEPWRPRYKGVRRRESVAPGQDKQETVFTFNIEIV